MELKKVSEKEDLLDPVEQHCCNKSLLCLSCCCANTTEDDSTTTASNGCLHTDLYFPKRLSLLIVLTLGMTIINALRVNVGVTVVAILHKTASSKVSNPETMAGISELDWSPRMVGWLHSMFFIGILIFQVPCGYIITKFPSTRLYGLCILLSGLLNFLLPVSITFFGYVTTCIIRLLQGMSEGMLYPSCYDILRIWSLPEEKSRMGATVLTGSYIGPVLGMFFSGVLTHYAGWPWVFYAHSIAVVFWYVFWFILAYESPARHPCISLEEKTLIETKQAEALSHYEEGPVPWFSILTSKAVWSLNICNFARSFVFYMLLTNQPTYFHLFDFTFIENGVFSSLPHALMSLVAIFSGSIADFLLTRPSLNTTFVRKLLTCVGFGVEGFLFFVLALVSSKVLSVTFLTLALGFSGLAISGWQINHLDIAPVYAGVLIAITMTFGTLAGVLNPLIVARLTKDQTLEGWHHVFWLTGGILLFSTLFYLIFGTGEKQSWASPTSSVFAIDKLDNKMPYGTFSSQPSLNGTANGSVENDSVRKKLIDAQNNENGIKDDDQISEKKDDVARDLKQRHTSITK